MKDIANKCLSKLIQPNPILYETCNILYKRKQEVLLNEYFLLHQRVQKTPTLKKLNIFKRARLTIVLIAEKQNNS